MPVISRYIHLIQISETKMLEEEVTMSAVEKLLNVFHEVTIAGGDAKVSGDQEKSNICHPDHYRDFWNTRN